SDYYAPHRDLHSFPTRRSSDLSTLFTIDEAIATLTFNRPEARNALTWEMYDALCHACDRVDMDRAIHVFIIKGAGGAFAAGTDRSEEHTSELQSQSNLVCRLLL